MKLQLTYFTLLLVFTLIAFCTVTANESNYNSNTVCLKKVQSEIAPNDYIEITDIYNRSYSGFFKKVNNIEKSLIFMKQEFGVNDILTTIEFENISQVAVTREKYDYTMLNRWGKIGILTGFGLGMIQTFKNDETNIYGKSVDNFNFLDVIKYCVIGGGVGAIIGFVAGKNVRVTLNISCK